jgi:hypothetical protein
VPLRLTLLSTATPLLLVVGQAGSGDVPHTALPLSVKLIVLPLTPDPPEVRVADRLVVPP